VGCIGVLLGKLFSAFEFRKQPTNTNGNCDIQREHEQQSDEQQWMIWEVHEAPAVRSAVLGLPGEPSS
jgi:hypothetical protein